MVLGAFGLASFIALRKHFSGENVLSRLRALIPFRTIWKSDGASRVTRPRVQIRGPKVKPLVCQICLGRIKEGLEYATCQCGKTFHTTCIWRTAFCPYCEEPYSSTSGAWKISDGRPRGNQGRGAKRAGERRSTLSCPVCGATLHEESEACGCGAIFVREGGTFSCPRCGIEVLESEERCPGCGEKFDRYEFNICPLCGKVIGEKDEFCECGAVFGNLCPECGHDLTPSESICSHCGTVFEII